MGKRLLKIPAVILFIILVTLFPFIILITWVPFGMQTADWWMDILDRLTEYLS